MKKLYLIRQNINNDYDTYSDAVVCAENTEQAQHISPDEYYKWHDGNWYFQYANGTEEKESGDFTSWCKPNDVKVKEIGIANDNIELESIICASFHAG